jgi:tetratricopeptide (TPR) repeat protein
VGVYFQWIEQALELSAKVEIRPELLTRLSHLRAIMLCSYGRFGFAVGYLEGALELARSVGDVWVEASCLLHLGLSWAARKEGARALRSLEAAREPARRAGAPVLLCELDKVMGLARYMLGDYQRAVECFERAVDLAREHDLSRELVVNLHNLGDALTRIGRYEQALSALRQSRGLANAHGHLELGDVNDVLIGCVEAVWTRRPESLERARRSLEAARAVGNNWVVVQSAYFLGVALSEMGEDDHARELLSESLDLARRDGNRVFMDDCQQALARLDSKGSG